MRIYGRAKALASLGTLQSFSTFAVTLPLYAFFAKSVQDSTRLSRSTCQSLRSSPRTSKVFSQSNSGLTLINRRWRAQALPSVRAHTLGNDIHRIDTARFGFNHEGMQTTGGRLAEFDEQAYERFVEEQWNGQPAAAANGIVIRNFVELRPPPQIYVYRHGARFHTLPYCSRDANNPRSISERFTPCQNCCTTERFEQ